MRWLIFSAIYEACIAVHFLSMWLSGIITITNSNGDSISPWKIPLWIFTSVKLFRLAVRLILQFCVVFSIDFMNSSNILYIFRQSIIQLWTRRREFKSWTRLIAFHSALIPLGKVWIQLFFLQPWANSRTDWVLQPWWGN